MSMPTNITWLTICLAGVGVYLVKQAFSKKNPAPYPPGPPGWPLIGNILDMPHIKPSFNFAEWGKKYGDISHIEVLGQHIIVLNSIKTAMEMMDGKSSVYSDRPILPMDGELCGWKHTLGFLPYGDRLRLSRKNIHRVIGSHAALNIYHPIEEVETHRFLKRVLGNPDQLQAHIRHTTGAVILRIFYGYEAKVPEWFSGAGFKRIARESRETLEEMAGAPYKFVEDQMAAGIAPKSFTSDLLEGRPLSAEETLCKMSNTRFRRQVSTINTLFLAMTISPDVQKKAQVEIDAVVGPDRLPSFADRDSLPYIEALVKEVLRWNAVAPNGGPRRVTEDDIHDGYYIPKGSLVMPNVWFMLNDPRTYANPSTICFGFGRRICPGLLLADASVWISTVMSLAVFDISKVIENGVEITPEIDFSSGAISHPKPVKCSIKARSAQALQLIQQDINY
ncbi:cytochrome P450 [Suillus paluster]|uniref:cytochrome P450 n=1 Tax=Suillus paluster TaxID=48578 RepID=UPI001B8692B6|nr:cytochrome P450 [Suillus paluster]KAG1753720.1 cytochrome P450 [Suillus paluster]